MLQQGSFTLSQGAWRSLEPIKAPCDQVKEAARCAKGEERMRKSAASFSLGAAA